MCPLKQRLSCERVQTLQKTLTTKKTSNRPLTTKTTNRPATPRSEAEPLWPRVGDGLGLCRPLALQRLKCGHALGFGLGRCLLLRRLRRGPSYPGHGPCRVHVWQQLLQPLRGASLRLREGDVLQP